MRFLADMGVAQRIVRWLRNEGHDAVHLREERLHRLPNGAIFEKAYAESRVILTFDLDFGEIIALSGGNPVSVILFRLHNTRAAHVMERLKKVLKDSGDDLEKGAIVVVKSPAIVPGVYQLVQKEQSDGILIQSNNTKKKVRERLSCERLYWEATPWS